MSLENLPRSSCSRCMSFIIPWTSDLGTYEKQPLRESTYSFSMKLNSEALFWKHWLLSYIEGKDEIETIEIFKNKFELSEEIWIA